MELVTVIFHLLLISSSVSSLEITSVPGNDGLGFIQTEVNSTVSLLCSGLGAPGAELVWLRDGLVVRLQEGNKLGNSSVCVSPVTTSDDGVVFSCHVRGDTTTEDAVTLNVTYAPSLSSSQELTVEEDGGLTLSCSIQANPPVSSVTWTLNGSVVDLEASGFSVTNDGVTSVLSTGVAQRGLHAGAYQCTVTSPMYGTSRRSFKVTVADRNTFPLMAIIAGVVVVCLTAILAALTRWRSIAQKNSSTYVSTPTTLTFSAANEKHRRL